MVSYLIMKTETIKISGMTCSGCVHSVENVIKQIAGVHDVTVQLKPGQATIHYDAEKSDVTTIKAAITDAGFDVAD